jgi:type IV pilus assembly protein PilM
MRRKQQAGASRTVGLRIGSSQVVAAHVRPTKDGPELVQLVQRPLPTGVVVGGEVRDAETLTRELKAFFSSNKLPRKDIRLGVASSRIGVRVADVPPIDDAKQFENAVLFRAQELLPIPVTDAIIDHVPLGETTGPDGEPLRRVLVAFAHRDLVDRYVDVCRGAGLRLSGIDLDAFALLRGLAVPEQESDATSPRAVVAVAVGRERTVLAVSDGKTCDFVRVLDWGGGSLDVALARALNIAPSEAEPIKHALSLDAMTPPEGLTPIELEAARAALTTEIAVLARELGSSLRFYQTRTDSLPIAGVKLAGGTAELGGLAAELERLLGAPVTVPDPLGAVKPAKKLKVPEGRGSFAIAVGLGMSA